VTITSYRLRILDMLDESNPENSTEKPEPTIGESYEIGERGEQIFMQWLPNAWIKRKQMPDFFIDYIVEIVENGEPTGRNFAAQVKGIKVDKNSATPLKFPAKGKHVRYWLLNCQHPVFIFLIDIEKHLGHWLFVQKYVREHVSKEALERQKYITLRFNPEENFNERERFFSALCDAEKYTRNLHPGSVPAALEKRRCELEQKEPRFLYNIVATEDAQTIQLIAKESFGIKITVENDKAELARNVFKTALEHGTDFTFPLQEIKFSGSKLFEELSGKKGELVLDFGHDIPGNMIFQVPTDTGAQTLLLNGQFRLGTKKARFRGELNNAPIIVECTFDLSSEPEAMSTQLEICYPLKRWQGQPVLLLPNFELLYAAFHKLIYEGGLQTEWFIDGIRFANGRLSGVSDQETKRFSETLAWFGRCRSVAEKYKINPILPLFETITREQIDLVNDLYGLLTTNRMVIPCPGFSARCAIRGLPDSKLESSMVGCVRFDHPDPILDVLGQPTEVGPLRTILTNVKVTTESSNSDGQHILLLKGDESSLRILERFSVEKD
jgi:Domain of unknown function (DUF4365)